MGKQIYINFNLDTKDIIKNTPDTSNDNSSTNFVVYNPSLKNNNTPSKPEILIYHSHTTESYGVFGHDNLVLQKMCGNIGFKQTLKIVKLIKENEIYTI